MKQSQNSLIKQYWVRQYGERSAMVIATAIRMNNDINGNPRHKVQIWVVDQEQNKGSIWSPIIAGYRRTKDNTYVLKSAFDLEPDLDQFMEHFELCVNEAI